MEYLYGHSDNESNAFRAHTNTFYGILANKRRTNKRIKIEERRKKIKRIKMEKFDLFHPVTGIRFQRFGLMDFNRSHQLHTILYTLYVCMHRCVFFNRFIFGNISFIGQPIPTGQKGERVSMKFISIVYTKCN